MLDSPRKQNTLLPLKILFMILLHMHMHMYIVTPHFFAKVSKFLLYTGTELLGEVDILLQMDTFCWKT